LLRQRKYDLAAEEYERFMRSGARGPDLADARFGLATARLYQGKFPEAHRAFEDFLKTAPDGPRGLTARYRLGELSYLLGDFSAARRSLEGFTAATIDHPGLEMAWTYLGDARFGLKEFAQARQAYERSLSTYPKGRLAERAKYGLGRTLAALGNRDQALVVLQELAAHGSAEWIDRAWLQIGMIRQTAGQDAEAIAAFSALVHAAPQSALRTEAQLGRALALVRLKRTAEAETSLRSLAKGASSPQAARAAFELATIELESNRPDAALATLKQALKQFPDSPLAPALQFRVAEVYQKQNHLADAQAQFERVSDANPTDPWADDALERAAQSALDRGDRAAARRLAGRFAARFYQSPLLPQVQLIDARAAAQEGKHAEAVAILKSLVEPPAEAETKTAPAPSLPPALAEAARYELALSYRSLGQTALAEAILAGLAQGSQGPITADAQFLLGQSHVEAGRYAEAIPVLEAYLAASSQGDVADVALAHLAAANVGLGRLDDAWKTLAKLSDRFPQSRALSPTRLRLAEAALAAHQSERAAEQFRLVAGVNTESSERPRSPGDKKSESLEPGLRIRALAGLGRSLSEMDKPAEAAVAFATALDLEPNGPKAAELALAHGRALEASKQIEPALKAYSAVLDRFPQSDLVPQAVLAQARLLAQAGRHDESARLFERLIGDERARNVVEAAGVTSDTLFSEWGWTLLDGNKAAEADRVFARLLQEYPTSPYAADARFNLAESANLVRNHAEVVRLLTPLVAMKPVETGRPNKPKPASGHTATHSGAAHDVGADAVGRLLPAALYRLGRTQVELNDLPAALVTLDRLLVEFPHSPYRREARYMRSEAALRNGDASAAESGFAALLDEPPAPTDPKGLIAAAKVKRIQCWVTLTRWNDALKGAESLKGEFALGDPAIAELDYARGQALLGLGRLDQARTAFQAVIDVRKAGDLAAQAQLMRGETYFHQDRFHEALRDFLKVDILHDSPRWQAAALLEAGKVYERLDRWPDAAETYERLLSKFPTEPSAGLARERLAAANRRATSTPNRRKS
jgi:TolA-binding protein